MHYFIYLTFHLLLLTYTINSNPIDDEIQLEKSIFRPTNRTITWRLEVDHSFLDWNKLHQDIQLAFDQWTDNPDVLFREASNDEEADIVVAVVIGNYSDGPYTVSIRINSDEASIENMNDDIIESLRMMLTNAILSSNDHAMIDLSNEAGTDGEVLYVDGEVSMNDIQRSNRIVRSTKAKTEKKKRKTKKCIKKKGKKICKPITRPTLPPIVTTTRAPVTEPPPVTFPPKYLDTIASIIKNSTEQNKLENFSKISGMINEATGLLPSDNIPILQELAVSYAHTTRAIKVSFADACALLSKFVVKAYNVMKRSMSKKDEEVLQKFATALTTDTLNQFKSFEKSSQNQLIEIHSKLLLKAHGDKMQLFLDQRIEEEKKVEAEAGKFKKVYMELSENRANVDSLRYEQEFLQNAMDDSEKAKKNTDEEIKKLEGQISSYEHKLLDHRNTRTEVYGSFWIFSWKVRDIIHDNGESFARENLNRLLDRIRTLKDAVKNWSNENAEKRVEVIKHNITNLLENIKLKENICEKYNKSYNLAEVDFLKVIKDIEKTEKEAGTVNVKSMQMVDRLARAVYSGQESFVDAYVAVKNSIGTIDIDQDLVLQSIQYALQFLRMGDDYMKTSNINNIKRSLGIV